MRLIDADELIYMTLGEDTEKPFRFVPTEFIEDAPTIEAVPVIRCKDCRWYDTSDISGTVEPIGYRCKLVARLWREPDDFCKRAERKEE